MKAKFTLILQNVMMTEMARCFDLFEIGKVVADMYEIEMPLKSKRLSIKTAAAKLPVILKQFENKKFKPVYLHLESVTDGKKIYINKEIVPFFDKKVRVISNGKSYYLFRDFLVRAGMKVKTTEHMFVKSVKF